MSANEKLIAVLRWIAVPPVAVAVFWYSAKLLDEFSGLGWFSPLIFCPLTVLAAFVLAPSGKGKAALVTAIIMAALMALAVFQFLKEERYQGLMASAGGAVASLFTGMVLYRRKRRALVNPTHSHD